MSEQRLRRGGQVAPGDQILAHAVLVNRGAAYSVRALLVAARQERARLEGRRGRDAVDRLADVELLITGLKQTYKSLVLLARSRR